MRMIFIYIDAMTESAANKPIPLATSLTRIKLQDLLKNMREIEIDHEGKIYRLHLTRANKLILTT